MQDNIKSLFNHVDKNDTKSIQMLSDGSLVEVGYTNSLGFYIYTEYELILFDNVRNFLNFAKKNLTYIGDV